MTSGSLRRNWGQGYCVQTALNTSFALLSLVEDRRRLCLSVNRGVYFSVCQKYELLRGWGKNNEKKEKGTK